MRRGENVTMHTGRQRAARLPRFAALALLLGLAIQLLSVPAAAASRDQLLSAPASGRVVDGAGILGAETVDRLNGILQELEQKNGVEFAVATVASAAPRTPDQYATDLFQAWRVGKKGRDNGLLIFLALKERRLKVEVGYGLEGIFNDGRVGRLLDDYATPSLKQGRYGEGFLALVREMANIAEAEYQATGTSAASAPRPAYVPRRNAGLVGGGAGAGLFLFFLLWALAVSVIRRPVGHRCPKCGARLGEEKETVRAATQDADGLERVHFHCPRCGYDRLADVILPALVAGALLERGGRFRGPFGPFGGGFGGFGGGGDGGGGGFGGFGGGDSGGGGAGRDF
jgi:uncharacterized protein